MNPIHSNENYEVVVDTNATPIGYAVVNRVTGVVEFRSQELVQTITFAEQSDSCLRHKLWRIITAQAEASAKWLETPAAALDELVLNS